MLVAGALAAGLEAHLEEAGLGVLLLTLGLVARVAGVLEVRVDVLAEVALQPLRRLRDEVVVDDELHGDAALAGVDERVGDVRTAVGVRRDPDDRVLLGGLDRLPDVDHRGVHRGAVPVGVVEARAGAGRVGVGDAGPEGERREQHAQQDDDRLLGHGATPGIVRPRDGTTAHGPHDDSRRRGLHRHPAGHGEITVAGHARDLGHRRRVCRFQRNSKCRA